jgi:hypothetical protein
MLRYLYQISTKFTAVPLINGSAFHEGKAEFYLTKSEKKAISKCKSEIKARRKEFQDEADYFEVIDRCPQLLSNWILELGKEDLKRFKIVGVEREFKILVPGTNFYMTVRIDFIGDDKSSLDRYIYETKTSSFSEKTTKFGVYYGDQATIYTWAVETALKKKIAGVVPDIAYWNKAAKSSGNIHCFRGDIIERGPTRIKQFLGGVAQLQSEIAQKVEAFKEGYDPYVLFQRNTHYCNAFFKPCEFGEICNGDITKMTRLPIGFTKGKRRIIPKVRDMKYVEDSCVGIY